MGTEEIRTFIQEAPTLIMYIVPGYLMMWIIWRLNKWKKQNDTHLIFKSVIASYLLISVANMFFGENAINSIKIKGVVILASLIIGGITGFILRSDYFWEKKRSLGISQAGNSFFTDISDHNNSILAKVYLPDDKVIYEGQWLRFDEREETEKVYIVLAGYVRYNYDGEEKEDHRDENHRHVLINTKDINRIELTYDRNNPRIR